MIVKNEEYIDIVVSHGFNGEGICKRDGFIIFVPFAIFGEKIKYKILKVSSNIAYGKLIEVIEPSCERIEPKCQVFKKCGGCQMQHMQYLSQVKTKEENIKTCFSKIAGLDISLEETTIPSKTYRYRNKMQLPVREDEKGIVIGFYAENSHRVIPITDCPINPEWAKDIISIFNEFFVKFNVKGYNEKNNSGDVREITIKEVNNNLIIVVVLLKNNLKNIENLILMLKDRLGKNFSLFTNVNNKNTNVIYGDEFRLVCGELEYEKNTQGIIHKMGVRSFSQVNDEICEKLYLEVTKQIKGDNLTVIDAYSGAGLMTAMLAKNSDKVIGIEIIKEAVDIANGIAKLNHLDHKMKNYCGKCEDIFPNIAREEAKDGKNLAVVLDPPRKGCDIRVLEAILKEKPDKIVYVSCLPSSLARDVGVIVGSIQAEEGKLVRVKDFTPNYKIEKVKAFDMFPQTKHVETVVCLKRQFQQ